MCFTVWYAAHLRGGDAAAAAAQPSTRPSGIAVVELFTSQGCSSCPPAEEVLADLNSAAVRDDRPVFTLAFHVDYWNRLGWADRFSDAAYSDRQAQYSKAFRLDEVYTPQMVVNGQKQFVGSERVTAERAIAGALAERPRAEVTVAVQGSSRDGYRVHANVTGVADEQAVVNVAVVEQGLSTEVMGGENSGRHLDEPSVVRWFKSVRVSDAGEVALPPLTGVRTDHASVVVYAQRPGNGPILGAAATSLP